MVTVKSGIMRVDIRKFWTYTGQEDQLRPTRSGISLSMFEWDRLKMQIIDMHAHVKEAAEANLCADRDDNMNQLGYLNCPECNPFTKHLQIIEHLNDEILKRYICQ